jgi:hypothetical protein
MPRPCRRVARSVVAATAAAALLALSTGPAQGWFGAVAAGTGSAPVGTLLPLSATARPVAPALVPGATADVVLELANPNDVAVRVDAIALDETEGDPAIVSERTGCDASALAFQAPPTAAGWLVPARTGEDDGRLELRLPGAVTMAEDAPSDCQGAAFTIRLRAS